MVMTKRWTSIDDDDDDLMRRDTHSSDEMFQEQFLVV